ncbi:MAG: hypothetical protein WBB67_08105 [bacterium]
MLKARTQGENWIYRYNGSGSLDDYANSVTWGADSNIYAAGSSYGMLFDFLVISFSPDGDTNWTYRYSMQDEDDEAFSVIWGADNNIYAAGVTGGCSIMPYYLQNIYVVSLTPVGNSNWGYWYNGPADDMDAAFSIIYGDDGYIYIAG